MKHLKILCRLSISFFLVIGLVPQKSLADGQLDATFAGGTVLTPVPGFGFAFVSGSYIQADGKIVVGCNSGSDTTDIIVGRYLTTGVLDATFGNFAGFEIFSVAAIPGIVNVVLGTDTNFFGGGNCVAVQSDGKIVLVGTVVFTGPNQIIVARLNADGSLDSTFNSSGTMPGIMLVPHLTANSNDYGTGVVVDVDGAIVLSAISDQTFGVVRLNPDGTLDTTFNGTGSNTHHFQANSFDLANTLALQADGRTIILAGSSSAPSGEPSIYPQNFAFAIFSPTGVLTAHAVTFFSTNAVDRGDIVTEAFAILVQPDTNFILIGYSDWTNGNLYFAAARYTSAGVLDTTFLGPQSAFITALNPFPVTGAIIVPSTTSATSETSQAYAAGLQSDGKILAAGYGPDSNIVSGQNFMSARLTSTGAYDVTWNAAGTSPFPGFVWDNFAQIAYSLALQGDGNVVLSGQDDGDIALCRLVQSAPLTMTTINAAPFSTGVTFTGNAQNPAIVDIFVDGTEIGSTTTIGATNTWSFTFDPPFSGFHVATGVARYRDDGHVNLAAQISFTGVCPNITGTTFTASGCVNGAAMGDLVSYVTGGTPPYDFSPTGASVGGNVSIGSSGPFTFTPNAGFSGVGSFGYQVTDANACVGTGSVNVTIAAPVAFDLDASACVDGVTIGDVSDFVDGGFGPPYTFSSTGTITCGTASVSPSGIFTFMPAAGFSGICSFQYQVADIQGCIATGLVNVDVSSPIAGSASGNLCVGGATAGNLAPLATGGLPDYVFSSTGAPVGGIVTINPTGPFNFTATSGFSGSGGFVYQVTDANDCSATGAVDLTIRSPIAGGASGNLCVSSATAGNLSGLVTSGFPPYGSFGLIGTPVGGTVTIDPTGPFEFMANLGFSGIGGFAYQVTDSNHCTSTGAVTITVASPITTPGFASVCLNGATAGNLSGLVASGFPPYTFLANGMLVGGIVTIDPTGPFNFTASAGFSGNGGFGFQVQDSNHCVNNGTFNLFVDNLVAQNMAFTICNQSLTGSLTDFVIGGSGALTFTGPLGPLTCTGNSVTIAPSGEFIYTGPAISTGPCSFNYGVSDAITCSSTGTITITANTAPIVINGTLRTCNGVPITSTLANFVIGSPPLPLTFSIVTPPVHGTISNFNAATGAFTYTPTAGYVGSDSFSFQVLDGAGCFSNITMITIGIPCCPITTPFFTYIEQIYWGITP